VAGMAVIKVRSRRDGQIRQEGRRRTPVSLELPSLSKAETDLANAPVVAAR
jgi:hypothetical protein